MDVGIKCNEGTFKLRACGVIVRDGKILVDKARNFNGFVFMGGHIELGENSRDGVVREIKEELGFDMKIIKLLCVNENLYPLANGGVAHEVAYYYVLEPIDKMPDEDFKHTEIDHGVEITHHFTWVKLEEAKNYNIRPNWVANMILEGKEDYCYLTDQTK